MNNAKALFYLVFRLHTVHGQLEVQTEKESVYIIPASWLITIIITIVVIVIVIVIVITSTYLIIVADAADAVSVNFSGRCKFLQI